MKEFVWKETWLYEDLNSIDKNHPDIIKTYLIKYIKEKIFPIDWLRECITEHFPQYIDTLNKILILL